MQLNCKTPFPITLNCWKHHAGFIKNQIKGAVKVKSWEADLQKILLLIGESQMDLYLGKLTPVNISNEIIDELEKIKVFHKISYSNWLSVNGKKYKLIEISDNSIWTLRLGVNEERYLHIHPGRQSPLTIRVKALTLKTAIAAILHSKLTSIAPMDLNFINHIRKSFLNLPPLKSLSSSSGLGKFLNMLNT